MSRKCANCTAWSQLVAHLDHESGKVVALCLNPKSPHHAKNVPGRHTCPQWSDDTSLSDLP